MRVKALRGVCVGPEDNMKEGDVRDLDPGTADYLKSIGAVADAPEEVIVQPEAPAGSGAEQPAVPEQPAGAETPAA